MEARLIALEDRLRQTEEVLVAERLARQTVEAAEHSQLVLVVVARDLLDCQVLSTRKRLCLLNPCNVVAQWSHHSQIQET